MKILPFFLIFFFLKPILVSAQEEKQAIFREVDSTFFTVKCFRRVFRYYTLSPGDQVIIDFDEARAEGLPKIRLISPSGYIEPLWKKTPNIEQEVIKIAEKGEYTFEFNNRAWEFAIPRHRKCRFQIWKIDSIQPLENFIAFLPDTLFKFVAQADTNIIPILDDSVYVSPTLDLTRPSRKVIPLTLPNKVVSWAFWVGANKEAKLQYDQLTQAGVLAKLPAPDPLYRFLRSEIQSLPKNTFGGNLNYLFTNYEGQSEFLQVGVQHIYPRSYFSSNQDIRADYGLKTRQDTTEEAIFLGVENSDRISGLNAHVKLMGMVVIPKPPKSVPEKIFMKPVSILSDTLSWSQIQDIMPDFEASLAYAKELFAKRTSGRKLSPEELDKLTQLQMVDDIIDSLNIYYGVTEVEKDKKSQEKVIDEETVQFVKDKSDVLGNMLSGASNYPQSELKSINSATQDTLSKLYLMLSIAADDENLRDTTNKQDLKVILENEYERKLFIATIDTLERFENQIQVFSRTGVDNQDISNIDQYLVLLQKLDSIYYKKLNSVRENTSDIASKIKDMRDEHFDTNVDQIKTYENNLEDMRIRYEFILEMLKSIQELKLGMRKFKYPNRD